MVYDEAGNPLTATFLDYALPSAAEFPNFEVHSTETPSPLNPLGAKGIGEASTIGSTPAVQNAWRWFVATGGFVLTGLVLWTALAMLSTGAKG